ncbi:MAG: 2Fe-2S iron-sulfur cluster-binding protein [Rhizobiaceae bacterium]
MPKFHSLTVIDISKTIHEAVIVTLAPMPDEEEAFDFIAGQYLTFRHNFDGEELRRSYSICAGKDESLLQVGIKHVDGGAFSTWANTEIKVGDTLEAMSPMGNFHTPIEPNSAKSYLGFAGGSGITPVLSIIKTTLAQEPNSSFTLVYANRAVNTIMFREELEDLKNRYMGRLSVIHILEHNAEESELFTGLVDTKKCGQLFKLWIDIKSVDTAFICGPEPMMLAIVDALKDHGLSKEQIKFELFGSNQPGRAAQKAKIAGGANAGEQAEATITLDGTTRNIIIAKGSTILDAAKANQMDVPFACQAGVCSTCRAKVIEGEVEMMSNHALEDYEVEQGYVLTCQSLPLGKVVIDYDQ